MPTCPRCWWTSSAWSRPWPSTARATRPTTWRVCAISPTPRTRQRVEDFLDAADSVRLTELGKELLQHATARFVYDFDAYLRAGKPAAVASIVREDHHRKNDRSPVQISFEYSNGLGQMVMKKVQSAPGIAKRVDRERRRHVRRRERRHGRARSTAASLDRQRKNGAQQQGQHGQAIRTVLLHFPRIRRPRRSSWKPG